jgi:hypothetical protein
LLVERQPGWGDGLRPTEVIEVDVSGFRVDQLERQVGFVSDITLQDETSLTGLIVAVSEIALILEGWDSTRGVPDGELSTLAIDTVRRIHLP